MGYNENLADRIRELLAEVMVNGYDNMMGSGRSFLVDDKLCVSVAGNDRMLVRLSPTDYEEAVEQNSVEPMLRNGKAMKGYLSLTMIY